MGKHVVLFASFFLEFNIPSRFRRPPNNIVEVSMSPSPLTSMSPQTNASSPISDLLISPLTWHCNADHILHCISLAKVRMPTIESFGRERPSMYCTDQVPAEAGVFKGDAVPQSHHVQLTATRTRLQSFKNSWLASLPFFTSYHSHFIKRATPHSIPFHFRFLLRTTFTTPGDQRRTAKRRRNQDQYEN